MSSIVEFALNAVPNNAPQRNLLRGTRFLSLADISEGGINLRSINSDASKVSIADGIDGNKAVKIITSSGETDKYRGVFFKAKVEPDTDYTVSAWVRGMNEAIMIIENIDSDGITRGSSYDYKNQLMSSGWQRITKTFHTHTNSEGYKGYVEVNFFVNKMSTFWISEPKMERGTEATAYTVNEADLVGEAGAPATMYTIEPSAGFNTGGTLSGDGKTVTIVVSGSYNVYKITGASKSLAADTLYGRLTIGTLTSDATITGGKGTVGYSKDYFAADKASIPTSCLLTVYSDSARTKVVASQVLSVSLNPNAIFDVNQQLGEITLMTTSQRSATNMWVNGDFTLPAAIAPAYIHNATTGATERIDDVDLPVGFIRCIVFNVPTANGGISFKGTQPHITTATIADTGGKTKNGYILSFYAKATKPCQLTVGLESSITGTVQLSSSWQRLQINIPHGSDLSKWTGAIIFYPTTAIGSSEYVSITGIQFEQGTGIASVWTKSEYDIERAGIRIGNGGIEAIAGKFDFVGKDGKPYIRVEQDKDGHPHFVFYDPVSDTPSYDLSSTGLSQIIESSQKLSFPRTVGGDFYIGSISTEDNTDVWNLSYENVYTHAMAFYEFHPAYFTKKDNPEKKIYVPGEAETLDGLLYDIPYVSDGLPLGDKVADGWYLYIIAKYDRAKNRGYEVRDDGVKIVNAADESVSSVSYLAYLVVGAKIKANFSINIETYPSTSSVRVPDVKSGGLGLNFSCDDTSEKYISLNKSNGKVYFHNPD